MLTVKQKIKKATKVYVGSPQSKVWIKVTKSALNNSLQGRKLNPSDFAFQKSRIQPSDTGEVSKILYVNLGVKW